MVASDGQTSSAARSAWAKRSFDLSLACVMLLACLPLWLPAAIGIKLSSPGPVFYVSRRVGVNGKLFDMYKFRTMHQREENGPVITAPNDDRVFSFGRILRATKIDELPQLLNVIKGDLSFVGPRPEDPNIVNTYYDDSLRASLQVRPGLTSAGTLYYMRHFESAVEAHNSEASYAQNILQEKLSRDMEYAATATVFSDIRIIFETGVQILLGFLRR